MASFMGLPLFRFSKPSHQSAQVFQFSGAITSGVFIDSLGRKGLDLGDINPQVLGQKPAHLRRGCQGNASLGDDLIGQSLSAEAIKNACP